MIIDMINLITELHKQVARPSCGSDDHAKLWSRLQLET